LSIEQYKIVVSDIIIDVTHKRIKNLHLSVHPPLGSVRISAPRRMKLESIRSFAVSKVEWIKKHQKRIQNHRREIPQEYLNPENHLYLGKCYLLNVTEQNSHPKVILNHDTIELFTRKNSTKLQRQAILESWYRKQLIELAPQFIDKWEKKMNVCVNEVRIKKMKTKWGTCNTKAKRIWLNLELAKKPVHCIEYLIVHEMVHLLERRHNERFKAYMDMFIPQWKQYRKVLNNISTNYEKSEY